MSVRPRAPGSPRERYDLAELKQRYWLPDVLTASGLVLQRQGPGTFRALCPFHPDRNPSFFVDVRKPQDPHWYCFGCVPPGSLVKTEQGMRPIEEVQSGDLVYAADGHLHRVVATHEHAFSGELVRLRCAPFKVQCFSHRTTRYLFGDQEVIAWSKSRPRPSVRRTRCCTRLSLAIRR